MKQLSETVKLQQNQITSLVTAIQQMPGVQEPVAVTVNPAVVAAEVIRAEKVQKLALNMRKSNRFKFLGFIMIQISSYLLRNLMKN